MKPVKRSIVVLVEFCCTFLDALPRLDRETGRWRIIRRGCWGCAYTKLAVRSYELDQRWQAGVWKAIPLDGLLDDDA